jgi:hypothetical protein
MNKEIDEKATDRKWTFESKTVSLADTGDYTSCVIFTNGKDTLQTDGDGLDDDEECQQLCDLLNKMPDLWSHRTDAAEFELSVEQGYSEAEVKELLRQQREKCARAYLDNFKNHGILNAPEPQLKSSLKQQPNE